MKPCDFTTGRNAPAHGFGIAGAAFQEIIYSTV